MSNFTYTTRKDGRLMKKVTVNGHIKYIYASSVKDLENKYIELKYNGIYGKSIDECNFKNYAKNWILLNSSGKAKSTIKEYNYIINKYLISHFGNYKLKSIKRLNIQQLQKELLDDNHVELAHKCIRYMKTICDDAIANGYLDRNPCFGIKEPKLIHKEKEILTTEQDKLLLSSAHIYAPFFRVLRYTGMRREEITALTINDIDLNNKTISINKAVSFASNQPELKETKNKKSRIVPILDVIYDDIIKRIDFCNSNDTIYLFPQIKNPKKMLSQESIRCMTNQICKSLEFTFTPHQLRHSYCTMLYYSGISIKQTQNLMGHSSAKMVYDLYAHLDEKREHISSKINSFIAD